jgi:hypothetical protein
MEVNTKVRFKMEKSRAKVRVLLKTAQSITETFIVERNMATVKLFMVNEMQRISGIRENGR